MLRYALKSGSPIAFVVAIFVLINLYSVVRHVVFTRPLMHRATESLEQRGAPDELTAQPRRGLIAQREISPDQQRARTQAIVQAAMGDGERLPRQIGADGPPSKPAAPAPQVGPSWLAPAAALGGGGALFVLLAGLSLRVLRARPPEDEPAPGQTPFTDEDVLRAMGELEDR